VLFARGFQHAVGQRVQHAAAGAGADHKIRSKGCDLFDVKQEDVFAFLVLQRSDDGVGKVKWIQESPH
jgi:hypothetical protein